MAKLKLERLNIQDARNISNLIIRDISKEPAYKIKIKRFPNEETDKLLKVEISLRKCDRLKVFRD